ncbi:3-deoxy-manno-octulosonate cytidylyltransferase [bacterium]|jgi:3-deoxy-manno-octulosonate cytidylyltransferase (CMP-KDO synthetase)|nr:3-deoxy-manno-octulosonate cytidylyltransferase [bacterium]MBT4292914.1 3-deoxy-manno-octulosonate cytidylyltransferase [bacterium]MBT7311587.1 3-deoxy-manno-octulosonate cytidylyltransferase [bacterium]
MKTVVVIPARYGSTRFPGKALALLRGKPLVVHAAQRASLMKTASTVLVATDDQRIMDVVKSAGFECVMTGEHQSGSDRVGEVVAGMDVDIVVNVQGDEPLMNPEDLDRLVVSLDSDKDADLGTLAHPFIDKQEWMMPNVVKLLVDNNNHAIYFSRAPLPGRFPGREVNPHSAALRHVGVYAWKIKALQKFIEMPPGKLEMIEGLEQLRALESGMVIKVVCDASPTIGVDTPEDLIKVEQLLTKND